MPLNLSNQYNKVLREGFALRGGFDWIYDGQFKVAMLIGLVVWLLMYANGVVEAQSLSWRTLLVVVLLTSLIEELFFRGALQSKLLTLEWGNGRIVGLSIANWMCSLCFMALHFGHHPPIWAISVFIPSLLFGYFRERHDSVYPAIALHVFYNALYFILPIVLIR